MMNFDDQPVGQHTKLDIPEQPPDEQQQEPASSPDKLTSLPERLRSKSSKLRLEAAAELLKLFTDSEGSDPVFAEHYPFFKHYLADSHPGVQEKALDAFLIFLAKSAPKVEKAFGEIVGIVIEKLYNSSKTTTKTKAAECLLLLAELEGTQAVMHESITNCLAKSAAPKTVASALQALTQLLNAFGSQVFPTNSVISAVTGLANSTQAGIRAEAMNYIREAHRWTPDLILPAIAKLRQAQQDELKKQFAEDLERPVPKREVKGQKADIPNADRMEDVKVAISKKEDKKEVMTAGPVLKRFGETWCSQLMALKKWSEKRDKLEELARVTNRETLPNECPPELLATLKKLLNDSNIVVVNLAIKIVGQLAKGLRGHVSTYARHILQPIVQKCKDKKTAMETQKCMHNLVLAIRMDEALEEINEGLNDKSPLVKARMCQWLAASVFPKVEATVARNIAAASWQIMVKLTDDAVSDVRDNALSCLGVITALLDDAALHKSIQELNAQKQEKITKSAEQYQLHSDQHKATDPAQDHYTNPNEDEDEDENEDEEKNKNEKEKEIDNAKHNAIDDQDQDQGQDQNHDQNQQLKLKLKLKPQRSGDKQQNQTDASKISKTSSMHPQSATEEPSETAGAKHAERAESNGLKQTTATPKTGPRTTPKPLGKPTPNANPKASLKETAQDCKARLPEDGQDQEMQNADPHEDKDKEGEEEEEKQPAKATLPKPPTGTGTGIRAASEARVLKVNGEEETPECMVIETHHNLHSATEQTKGHQRPSKSSHTFPKEASRTVAKKKSTKAAKAEEVKGEDVGALPSPEEAANKVTAVLPSDTLDKLGKAEWKERLQGLQELHAWAKETTVLEGEILDALAVLLKQKLKDFKESNQGLVKESLALLQTLGSNFAVSKKFASVVVSPFVEKMADVKLIESCCNLLLAIADSATPMYVITTAVGAAMNAKSLNVLKGMLGYLARALEEYGASLFPIKVAVEFAKQCLAHANQQVRTAATSFLAIAYSFFGEPLKTLLVSNLKEATYKTVEAELARIKPKEGRATETKRKLKGEAEREVRGTKKHEDAAEALCPRTSIASQLTSKLLAGLADPAMKHRQEAKETIEKLLANANHRLLPTGLTGLVGALKGRMSEPCKNLAKGFITLVGNLGLALGPACKQYAKMLLPSLMSNLADKQSAIRAETVLAMDRWAEAGGSELVLNTVASFLEKDNPEMRAEVLNWLLKNKQGLNRADATTLVAGLVAALQDRSKDIRVLSESLVAELMPHVGFSAFANAIQDLKPAVKTSLQPVLEKYKVKIPDAAHTVPTSASRPAPDAHPSNVADAIPADDVEEMEDMHEEPLAVGHRKREPSATDEHRMATEPMEPMEQVEPVDTAQPLNSMLDVEDTGNSDENKDYEENKIQDANEADEAHEANNVNEANGTNEGAEQEEDQNAVAFQKLVLVPEESERRASPTDPVAQPKTCTHPQTQTKVETQKQTQAQTQMRGRKNSPKQIQDRTQTRTPGHTHTQTQVPTHMQIEAKVQDKAKGKQQETTLAQQKQEVQENAMDDQSVNESNRPAVTEAEAEAEADAEAEEEEEEEVKAVSETEQKQEPSKRPPVQKQPTRLKTTMIMGTNQTRKQQTNEKGNAEQPKTQPPRPDSKLNSRANAFMSNSLSTTAIAAGDQVAGTPDKRPSTKDGNEEQKPKTSSTAIRQSPSKSQLSSSSVAGTLVVEMLVVNSIGSKERRAEQDKKMRWPVNEIRADYVEKLKKTLQQAIHPSVLEYMFARQLKKNLEAVRLFTEALLNEFTSLHDILDLIYKWMTMQTVDQSNPVLNKAILEFVRTSFQQLVSQHLPLVDCEAASILPMLCERMGSPNSALKEEARQLLLSACELCSVVKVMGYLLGAFESKTQKTKFEALALLKLLVTRHGPRSLSTRDLKAIAKLLASPDSAIKAEAADLLAQIVKQRGDSVLQAIGELPQKAHELLKQHLASLQVSSQESDANLDGYSPGAAAVPATKPDGGLSSAEVPLTDPSIMYPGKPEGEPHAESLNEPSSESIPEPMQESRKAGTEGTEGKLPLHHHQHQHQHQHQHMPTPMSLPMRMNDIHGQSNGLEPMATLGSTQSTLPEKVNGDGFEDTKVRARNKSREQEKGKDKEKKQEKEKGTEKEQERRNVGSREAGGQTKASSPEHKDTLESCLGMLRSCELAKQVDALVLLNEKATTMLEHDKETLVRGSDRLFTTFAEVLEATFEKPQGEIPIRFAKYFLSVANKICALKPVAQDAKEDSMSALLEQLLSKMVFEGLSKMGENGEGEAIIKTLNLTTLKLLENCNPTRLFVVLLRLFKRHKNATPPPESPGLLKLPGLVVKCILKLNKVIQQLLPNLDIARLLVSLHEYMVESPVPPQTRSPNDEIGTRVVKTILNDLVKVKREAIWDAYRTVEHHSNPDIYLKKWIGLILKSLKGDANLPPSASHTPNSGAALGSASVSKEVPVSVPAAVGVPKPGRGTGETASMRESPDELKEIFKGLNSQSTFNEAIRSLGEYMDRHPQLNLQQYFASCSRAFSEFVMSSLQKVQAEERLHLRSPGTSCLSHLQMVLTRPKN